MSECLIAVGSSLGDRRQNIGQAIAAIAEIPGTRLIRQSTLIETAPAGGACCVFVNGCLTVETSLDPRSLIGALLSIEAAGGRDRRPGRNLDRSIDLDILLFGDLVLVGDKLTIPHPRMSFRRFVLEPAAEIAGSMVHPLFGTTVDQLRCRIANRSKCIGIESQGETDSALTSLIESLNRAHSGWTVKPIFRENLDNLAENLATLNLLIEAGPPVVESRDLWLPNYHGPRWQTGLNESPEFPGQLPGLVTTAIESMAPLSSAQHDSPDVD